MKKLVSLFLLTAMLTVLLLPCASAVTNDTMYVATANHGTLNVRSSPSMANDRNVIGKLSYGHAMEVLDYMSNGLWVLVLPENWNRSGYVLLEHLSYDDPLGGGGGYYPSSVLDSEYVSQIFNGFTLYHGTYTIYANPDRPSGWVNLRWAPSTKAAVQTQCYRNRSLQVIAENNYWYQVSDSQTGYVGFIQKQYTLSGGYGSSY